MCGLWGQESRGRRLNLSCRSTQGQHVTSTQGNLKISNRMMLLSCLQSQSKLTLNIDPRAWMNMFFVCLFFYHLEQIGCISSVIYFIKTAQTGGGCFRAGLERRFLLLIVSGDNDRLARPTASRSRLWYIKTQIAHEHQSKQLVRRRYLPLSSDIIHIQLCPW